MRCANFEEWRISAGFNATNDAIGNLRRAELGIFATNRQAVFDRTGERPALTVRDCHGARPHHSRPFPQPRRQPSRRRGASQSADRRERRGQDQCARGPFAVRARSRPAAGGADGHGLERRGGDLLRQCRAPCRRRRAGHARHRHAAGQAAPPDRPGQRRRNQRCQPGRMAGGKLADTGHGRTVHR